MSAIDFGPGRTFVATCQAHFARLAQDEDYNLWQRVLFVALASANRAGHAEFAQGYLAEYLSTTPAMITRALRVLKDKGYVASTSTARCIVLLTTDHQGGRPGESCGVHGLGRHARKRARQRRDAKRPKPPKVLDEQPRERPEPAELTQPEPVSLATALLDAASAAQPEPADERPSAWELARQLDDTPTPEPAPEVTPERDHYCDEYCDCPRAVAMREAEREEERPYRWGRDPEIHSDRRWGRNR